MENVCRLCANVKTPKQLICNINEQIERKLIDCCRWNSCNTYETYSLPQKICNECLKCLEDSWSFAEKVEQAQQYLLSHTEDIKPTISLNIESVNLDVDTFEQNESVENIKMSFSPSQSFDYDDDFYGPAEPEENETKSQTIENINSSDIQPKAEQFGKRYKNKINLLSLLSDADKNADGTIKQEKIAQLNLHDYSVIKCWRCSVCSEIHENYRQLKVHFDQNHCSEPKSLCFFCNTSIKGDRRSVIRHINRHLPYLKHWYNN